MLFHRKKACGLCDRERCGLSPAEHLEIMADSEAAEATVDQLRFLRALDDALTAHIHAAFDWDPDIGGAA